MPTILPGPSDEPAAPPPGATGSPGLPDAGTGPVVLALAVPVLLLVVVAVTGRDLWFFSDDWNIYAQYHDGGLLEPFNGHLSALPAGIYQLLFHTVGVGSYLPYRLAGLAALAVLAFQLLRLVSVRLRAPAAVALALAAVLWNSSGQMNLLFPFLMNFSIPIAALFAIWWHLDRSDHDAAPLGHEVAASLWLAAALATSGLGLMALAAVGVELVVRRAPLRRWAVLAPGPLLWALWYATNRGANEVSTDLVGVASYSARMLLGATTSLGAGWTPLGVVVAVALVGYLVTAALRWRSLDGRTLGALAAPAAFVVLTALTRLDTVPEIPPDELRYSWAIAAYLVAAVVVAHRADPDLAGRLPRPVAPVAAGIAAAVLAVGAGRLVADLEEWNERVADARPGLSTLLYATEAVGPDRIDPDIVIPLSYVPVTTGGYLDAAASVGSPLAGTAATGLGGAALNRTIADELLVEQLPIRLGPADAATLRRCTSEVERRAAGEDGRLLVAPGTQLVVTPGGDAADGAVEVGLARFAIAEDAVSLRDTTPGPALLEIPDDAAAATPIAGLDQRWPYRVSLPEGASALRCD